MHWAAKLGKPDCIKLLHGYRVEVNIRSHCGYTPLHLAAMNGSEECVDVLVNLCSTSHRNVITFGSQSCIAFTSCRRIAEAMPNVKDFYGRRPKRYLKRTCSTKIQRELSALFCSECDLEIPAYDKRMSLLVRMTRCGPVARCDNS